MTSDLVARLRDFAYYCERKAEVEVYDSWRRRARTCLEAADALEQAGKALDVLWEEVAEGEGPC